MHFCKRAAAAGLILCMAVLFSGCLMKSADELYSLPKRSEEYYDLQKAVESAMGTGGVYCAPISGDNQQAVQRADLNGDGEDEILTFAKVEGDKPLRVLVFRRRDGEYALCSTIEGDGTAFESVQYAQVDGAPGMELIVGRQVSDQVLQSLSVYSMREDTVSELMNAGYSAYTTTDLDRDGTTDIFLLRPDSEQRNAVAELYRWQNGELARDTEANLSTGADSIKRIITGNMAENVPAVFVASTYDEKNLITDVFAVYNGALRNISVSDESGTSTQTVRNYYVYGTDIDGDGLIELPSTLPLTAVPDDEFSASQYRINWYNLNLEGGSTSKLCTYHNFAEGWYLVLPEQWLEQLTVTKKFLGDDSGCCFGRLREDGTVSPILTVYAFDDELAASRAVADGRILLAQKGEVYYSAQIGTDLLSKSLDDRTLRSMFRFISTDLLINDG